MIRPKVKAALFLSFLVTAALGVTQTAHAAEATGAEAQQSSSTSVVVESTSVSTGTNGSSSDSNVSIQTEQNSQVIIEETIVTERDSGSNPAPADDSNDPATMGTTSQANLTTEVGSNPTPGRLESKGIGQTSPQHQLSSGASYPALRERMAPIASLDTPVSEGPQPGKSDPAVPTGDGLQTLTGLGATLPSLVKGFIGVIGVALASRTAKDQVIFIWCLLGLLIAGYTVQLRRSGFSHAARSDVPANGIWNLFTPQKVSFARVLIPSASSLFSGVKNN